MQRDELLKLRRAEPFEPFRVHVADGAAYDVDFAENMMVGYQHVFIGVDTDETGLADHVVEIDPERITRIEPLRNSSKRRRRHP